MERDLKVPTVSEMRLNPGIVYLVGAGPQCCKNLPFHTQTQADALPVPLAMLMSPDSCQGLISSGTRPDAALAGAWLCLTLPGHISTTEQPAVWFCSKSWAKPGGWESHPALQLLTGHVIPGNRRRSGGENALPLTGRCRGGSVLHSSVCPSNAAHVPSQPFTRGQTPGVGKFHKN